MGPSRVRWESQHTKALLTMLCCRIGNEREDEAMGKRLRPDHDGTHRLAFERNKKRIMATQDCCGICGKPVDKKIPYPNPLSPCIDHIIPIDRGGHPSDLSNLQLAHWICNRKKSNKLIEAKKNNEEETVTNRMLPQSCDWKKYRAGQQDK